MLEINTPVTVAGNLHGQLSDLLKLFEINRCPPAVNYLFLGNYINNGPQSLEVMLLLFCFKIKYPENIFLLRGTHETKGMTEGKANDYLVYVLVYVRLTLDKKPMAFILNVGPDPPLTIGESL